MLVKLLLNSSCLTGRTINKPLAVHCPYAGEFTHSVGGSTMKASTFLAVLIAAGVCYSSSLAQEKTPRVDKREKIQKERIKDGVKSGELTRRETRRLAAEQKKIRNDEARAKADGIVTPRERARLNKELNRASRDIHRQKHDNQKRK